MKRLNQIELQNLIKMIQINETDYEKLISYVDYAVDPQIKQVLNKAAQEALNDKQKLLTFIKI